MGSKSLNRRPQSRVATSNFAEADDSAPAISHDGTKVAYRSERGGGGVYVIPSLGGSELYMKALMGATPLLAPGTMIQLGLVGLAFAFRHPAFAGSDPNTHSNEET